MSELERLGPELVDKLLKEGSAFQCHFQNYWITYKSNCLSVRLGSFYRALHEINTCRPDHPHQYTLEGYATALKGVFIGSLDSSHDECARTLGWGAAISKIEQRDIPMGDRSLQHLRNFALQPNQPLEGLVRLQSVRAGSHR